MEKINAIGIDFLALQTVTGFCRETSAKLKADGEEFVMDLIRAIHTERITGLDARMLLRLLGDELCITVKKETEKVVAKHRINMSEEELIIAEGLRLGIYMI